MGQPCAILADSPVTLCRFERVIALSENLQKSGGNSAVKFSGVVNFCKYSSSFARPQLFTDIECNSSLNLKPSLTSEEGWRHRDLHQESTRQIRQSHQVPKHLLLQRQQPQAQQEVLQTRHKVLQSLLPRQIPLRAQIKPRSLTPIQSIILLARSQASLLALALV